MLVNNPMRLEIFKLKKSYYFENIHFSFTYLEGEFVSI